MSTTFPENLAEELKRATTQVVEQLADRLAGRTFSPRIKFLSIEQVEAATGLGKSTIYKMVGQGKFPQPQANLGKNLWRESALIAWADANDPNRTGGQG